MESIDTAEQVVLEVNGVTVDLDVIGTAAKIEMNNNNNNNEANKSTEKISQSQEAMIKSENENAEMVAEDEPSKNMESAEGSTNTNNGDESSEKNELKSEGDLKVDHAPSAEKTESSNPLEQSEPSVYATVSESAQDDIQTDAESSDTNTENNSEGNIENSAETTKPKEVVANEQSANIEQEKKEKEEEDVTVTATATEPAATTTTTTTKATTEDKVQPKNELEGDDANKTVNDDSAKRSPRKKATNKKRKNRSRSQKKETDYSDLVKYTLSVSQRQRRYSLHVAHGRVIKAPADDCEIFCSNIPINVLEGELIPLFERYGKIWELRLMMSMRNPKRNAGFAFVRYTSNEAATEAIEKLNNYEILPGKHVAIRLSQPNLSLFVGNIHRGLTREQIHEKMSNRTTGLVKTFVKSSLYEDTKNCGFCFLEYDCHSAALDAKRLLNRGNVWGRQLFVDWAQRRKQPEESDLTESKTLFINNLPKEITEQQITDSLSSYGTIENVTKIKDYAFVLFDEHQSAENAMNGVDKVILGNENIEISLAMPKSMKNSRPRFSTHPSYRHQKPYRRVNNRNTHFKRFNTSFGSSTSSNKFYMRKQQKQKKISGNDPAGAANVKQTIIPTTIPDFIVTSPAETLAN